MLRLLKVNVWHAEHADSCASDAGHDVHHVQDAARIALELDVAHADGDDNALARDLDEDLDVKLRGKKVVIQQGRVDNCRQSCSQKLT